MHLLLKKSDTNKNKRNIENVTRCRDSRSEKRIETGRDDSIKQFSTQLHNLGPGNKTRTFNDYDVVQVWTFFCDSAIYCQEVQGMACIETN